MRRPWEQGGRWWRALSVVMLLLAACAVPPAGPEPATSRQAAPSAGPSAGSVGAVGAAEADAASILLLRQAVAQQQAQIKPDGASAGGSFRAVQPAPGLQLRFGPSGVEATPAEIRRTALREARPEPAPAWRWRMALAGLGYAAEPPPVGEADLVLAGERLEYRRGSVVEWYRNEPGRLEQGFTLPERPAGGPIGQPLRLTLTIDSDLTAHVDAAEQAVTWVDANGLVGLKYHGLRVVDA